jgi:hypothetical protein
MNTTELTSAERDVIAERRRQVAEEGFTARHDDEHVDGALARAGAAYAYAASWRKPREARLTLTVGSLINFLWPFDAKWWKQKDRRRDLVRAGALIIAEIERHDRLAEDEK